MLEDYGDLMTVEEVAKELHLTAFTVRSLIRRSIICAIKLGNKYVIPRKRLVEYLTNHLTA